MELPSLGSFDSAQPEAFYLGLQAEELLATADALLVVQGQGLRDQQPAAKRARQGGTSSQGAAPAPAAAAAAREPAVLEQALEEYSLREVALFLRLVYRPDDASPSRLYFELGSLAGAASLAHQLDAPRVLKSLVAAMEGTVKSLESHSLLAAWLAAAERCQLDGLRAYCIHRLAELLLSDRNSDRLAGTKKHKRTGLERAMDDVKQLQDVSRESLQVLVGALLSGARNAVGRAADAPSRTFGQGRRGGRGMHIGPSTTATSAATYLPGLGSIRQVLSAAGEAQQAAAGNRDADDSEVEAVLNSMEGDESSGAQAEDEEGSSADD
ncbi:hypothetical protein C2E21_2818 [Chlorella sorokiniana]|uniref:Uncharacterized protein n=1 Tax=Chlorella sorokiniana TaxID=3076 RepID=A0A2P6TW46_CHLSO|nr:hypothetical protein C2E21_2818 [Chlorella sorokiniana]|eukprot:PRW58293.1 hypothetical protein C2E21_2818 [Chlorella sorokiniana]